jgi:hypothetical protein
VKVRAISFAIRGVAILLIALIAWIILGYAALIPLGAIFGWSGHPALPASPLWIYGGLYLLALPTLCLYMGWRTVKSIATRIDRTDSVTRSRVE